MIEWSKYQSGNHRISCPECGRGERDKSGSLKIESDGRGVFHCFRCNCTHSQRSKQNNRDFRSEAQIASSRASKKIDGLSEWAKSLWTESHQLSGPALSYLEARKCCPPPPDSDLRWHTGLRHPNGHEGPALLALVTNIHTRKPISLHRTWITSKGKADVTPSRLLLKNHSIKDGVIRLWPDDMVTHGLGIAEGIETALSLAHGCTPVWACIDAGHLASFPVLNGVTNLIIARDMDKAGIEASQKCGQRWANADRFVKVTTQTTNDVNDYLMEAV